MGDWLAPGSRDITIVGGISGENQGMTIALFLLAAAGPCAVPTLCPSHDELVRAVRENDAATEQAVANTVPEDLRDFTSVRVERARSISDMVCGDALAGTSRSMNCKFTLHYARRTVYRIATFVWKDGRWTMTACLAVSRDRS